MLANLGFNADIARNGIEALTALRESELVYGLILMDCQMPEMDGFETTKSLLPRAIQSTFFKIEKIP